MTGTKQMEPKDVLKLIKRARAVGPCHIGMHVTVSMPTGEGMHFPYPTMVSNLTLKQATKVLLDMQGFRDRKVKAGQPAAMLDVRDSVADWDGRTRFISFG